MKVQPHRQHLEIFRRKQATDDEASSDISSSRNEPVFTDSEYGESLNEAHQLNDGIDLPMSEHLPSASDRHRHEGRFSIHNCCTGLCWLHKQDTQDEWDRWSGVLVKDRRMFPKRKGQKLKKPHLYVKRRIQKVTVGVQTSPEDFQFEENSNSINSHQALTVPPSGLLNPLETSVNHSHLTANGDKDDFQHEQEQQLLGSGLTQEANAETSCVGLNPFAQPFTPQLHKD